MSAALIAIQFFVLMGRLEILLQRYNVKSEMFYSLRGEFFFAPSGWVSVGKPLPISVLRFDSQTGNFIDEFIPAGTGDLDGAGWLVFSDASKQTLDRRPKPRYVKAADYGFMSDSGLTE